MADPKPEFKVIIIGSGLSGSLLANGLALSGVQFTVYERLKRHSKREGYQIRLGGPALTGMRACLPPDRLKLIVAKFGRAAGSKSTAPVVYNKHFVKLIDLTRFSVYSKSAAINRVILRDSLAEPIFDQGKLHYERSFARYEIRNPGTNAERVVVWFDDGSWDECDILVGADGSHSKVNEQLGLKNIRDIPSYVSMVAKSELPTNTFQSMSKNLRAGPAMTFADEKAFYFAAYLPDELDELGDRLESTNKDDLSFDDSMSSSMFGLHVRRETVPADLSKRSKEEKWEVIASALRGWSEEFHEIIELVKDAEPYIYTPRASSKPSKSWRSKLTNLEKPELGHARVWVIGDAMHAMLPTRGMGGNQSMQDAATVLPLLKRLSLQTGSGQAPTTDEVKSACEELENEMIPRAFAWVLKSGGFNIVPVDSSTLSGRIFFFIAALIMRAASVWYKIVGLVSKTADVDDAPELRD